MENIQLSATLLIKGGEFFVDKSKSQHYAGGLVGGFLHESYLIFDRNKEPNPLLFPLVHKIMCSY